MKRHRFLVGCAVLLVSLFVTTQAPAKESNFDGAQNKKGSAVVFMNRQELLRMAKSLGLAVRTVKFSTRDKARLANLPSKGCGCAAPYQDQDLAGNGCFVQCLKANGVSSASLASCGAVCSVNLIGCAICAGVSEWIILGCVQYCVWITENRAPKDSLRPGLLPSRTRDSHQAKLLLKPAHARS
jgi:hypothetical protein